MAGALEPPTRPSREAASGYPIVGRYVLCDEIAAGGMATVHVGRLMGTAGFARTVAIKRLHAQFARDPDFVAMFLDEARLAGRIRHPNVVPTLDVVVQDGEMLVVMEYVHGESLARLTRACRAATGAGVPVPIAMSVISAALYGLHAAHETRDDRGRPLDIVHRDVSPQNILVGLDGTARVVDFGVAKAAGRLQTTREGALKGKLAYMSPEQASADRVDRRADIYAASVVLWEVLTGRRLFTAETELGLFRAVVAGAVTPPSSVAPGLPPEIDALVMRGLAHDPAQRYATAAEMAEAAQHIAWATSGQVGAWVKQMCGVALDTRAARVVEIESSWVLSSARLSLLDIEGPTAPYRAAEPPAVPQIAPAPSAPQAAAPATSAEPDASAARAADLPSQITSLNVASSPLRPRRGPILLALGAPLVLAAIVLVFVLFHFEGQAPAPASSSAPVAASATPPAPASDAPPVVTVGENPKPPTSAAAPASASAPPAAGPTSAEPRSAASAPAAPTAKARARPAAGATRPGCNPPYTVDASGVRVPKMECL